MFALKRAAITLTLAVTVVSSALQAPAVAEEKSIDVAMETFHNEEAIGLAFLLRQNDLQAKLKRDLAFYQPIEEDKIGAITDIAVLRAQLIAAQRAEHIAADTVSTAFSPADIETNSLTAKTVSALAAAAATQTLTSPFTQSLGGTRELAVFDTTQTGLAPTSSPATSTVCNVLQYLTAGFGTTGPQFISTTGATTGQKNSLSIAGFALGIVPVALNCTKDKSTTPASGQQQKQPGT